MRLNTIKVAQLILGSTVATNLRSIKHLKMRKTLLKTNAPLISFVSLIVLLGLSTLSIAAQKPGKPRRVALNRSEIKLAEGRLAELKYWTGPIDGVFDEQSRQALIAFQKIEGRAVTGILTRDEIEALAIAKQQVARDAGYKHIEVDLDRQVLFIVDDEGSVEKILPVSTGSGKYYDVKGMKGTAYTPRGRFRVYAKASGWKKSPLGLLYYPSYISDGIAIHGNPEVPSDPQSHGCIRIPMFAAVSVSRMMPVGTIVLLYDTKSFVSAKQWAEEDKAKQSTGAAQ